MKVFERIIFALLLILIPVLFFSSKLPFPQGLVFSSEKPTLAVETGWEYSWKNSKEKGIVNLPGRVKGGAPGEVLYISNTLPAGNFEDPTLFIRTSQQYLQVYIEGRLIYSYPQSEENLSLPGSAWHFIHLPQDYRGNKIEITLASPYSQYTGHVNSIHLGNKSSEILDIIRVYGGTLVISCITLLLGILQILLFFTFRAEKNRFKSILYLGLFSFLSGAWVAAESKIIQFIIGSPILIFYLACISLFLMPIPLMLFIKDAFKPRKSGWLSGFVRLFAVFFVIVALLQLFDRKTFMDSVLVFHLLLGVCIIMIFYISIEEMLSGNKSIRLFSVGCIILCLCSILDIYGFYSPAFPGLNAQGAVQYGILIFISLMSASMGYGILDIFNMQARNEAYVALAYTDILTGLKNRTSFEEKIACLNENLVKENNIAILMFDLNNLKHVNDSLGHKEGDRLISSSARLISDSFSKFGEVYRIGGDEFAVIIVNFLEAAVKQELLAFEKKVEEYNGQGQQLEVGIACGMATFMKERDTDLHSVLIRADRAMYSRKQDQKQSFR